MKKFSRLSALLLVLVMAVGMLAACGGNDNSGEPAPADSTGTPAVAEPTNDNILVIGVAGSFEEKWNPFLVESSYDHEVVDQIFSTICYVDSNNELQPSAGDVSYEEQEDGSVIYTITLQEGLTFTDGTPVTIDDYIYGIYVRSDASYTGPGHTMSGFIEGVPEYFYDDPDYSTVIAGFEAETEKYLPENLSFEDFLVYMNETEFDPEAVEDYAGYIEEVGADFPEYTEALAAVDETDAEAVFEIYAKIEYDIYLEYYDLYNYYLQPMKDDYAAGNIAEGVSVPEISGVVKVDDYTCTVKMTQPSIIGDRELTDYNGLGFLIPKHYYGDFDKGDVSKIMANLEPMGSGPYIWGGFSDGIATCTANPDYWEGTPKTGTVRWQYIPNSDIIEAVVSGQVDIAEPSGTLSNVKELNDKGVLYAKYDNAGYGYMGMNCQNVPLLVRKGVWSLMNRQPSVEGYYGTGDDAIAKVIERPLTTVLAEYPTGAEQYYEYSPEKALEYFEEAGYTQDASGKLVDATGKQLVVNAYIGGEGKGDHPAYAMLTQAAEDMTSLGGELQIQDVNFNVLQSAMNDGSADIFILAWGAQTDCDRSAQFHTFGGQNRYRFSDAKMDDLLEKISTTLDLEERKVLVSEMLDWSMENCIELPLYQRYNLQSYNEQTLNMDTITECTPFYDYKKELWKVEMTI